MFIAAQPKSLSSTKLQPETLKKAINGGKIMTGFGTALLWPAFAVGSLIFSAAKETEAEATPFISESLRK